MPSSRPRPTPRAAQGGAAQAAARKGKKASKNAVPIRGLIPGMALHFAGCCHPLPGDRIVGIVTTGKGVTIHTIDCETLETFADTPERWLDVAWDDEGDAEHVHVGRIDVTIGNEPGSLGSLTTVIGKNGGNITNLKITNRSQDFFEILVDIEVQGRAAPDQHHRRAARDAGDQFGRARARLTGDAMIAKRPLAPRRQHRPRRHHPQRARRTASRSGARRAARRRRPAPTASPRICARTAATSPTTTSRGSRARSTLPLNLEMAATDRDARRSRCGTGRTPPAWCRRSATSSRPRAGSMPPAAASTSRRSCAQLARRRHPRLAVHRSRAAPARGGAARSARRWSSSIPAPIARRPGAARAARARSASSPPPPWPKRSGLECHAGHGLGFDTVGPVAAIPTIVELNIGHFLIGEAIFSGLDSAVRRMRALMDKARQRERRREKRLMILGIGSDLIDIRRIERAIERFGERFLDRIFTHGRAPRSERRADRAASYAKRFAAKGGRPKALAALLAKATGAGTDRAGHIEVLPDCTLPGHPEVFAVGDMMSLNGLPGVAEVAMQSGIHAARTIKRRVAGDNSSKVFVYRDLGSMATISRFRAVVSFKGIKVGGFLGWLMWAFVHLTFLTGFKNRWIALFKWISSFVGASRDERTITMQQASARIIAGRVGVRPGEEDLSRYVDDRGGS